MSAHLTFVKEHTVPIVIGAIAICTVLVLAVDFLTWVKLLVYLVVALLAVFFGFCLTIYITSKKKLHVVRTGNEHDCHANTIFIERSHSEKKREKLDMRLSGSAIIDEILHEMIDYTLRDYIHHWYDHVSEDDQFIYELRKTIQETLVNLSSRIKEVDWTPFLTTNLVDDAASHLRLYRRALMKVKENSNYDLISVFFDLEASMEDKKLCRDMVSTDDGHLDDYVEGIVETILYLVLPPRTYGCASVGTLTQNIIAHYVLKPLLEMFSDPDYVNQCIVWLCQNFPVSSDVFFTVIRSSDNMDEMVALHDYFTYQLQALNANSCKNPEDRNNSSFKSQRKSLNTIIRCVEQRLSILKEGNGKIWDSVDGDDQWYTYVLNSMKLPSLSLEEILSDKHSVALPYFMDYMGTVGGSNLCFLYFNISAWKNSADCQFTEIDVNRKNPSMTNEQRNNCQAMMECLQDAATNIYKEFLTDMSVHRVKLPEAVMRRFDIQMRTEGVNPRLFDEIHETVLNTMQTTEKFYPSFIRHKMYIKCLMDMDLLKPDSLSSHSHSGSEDEEDELPSAGMGNIQTSENSTSASIAADSEPSLQAIMECQMCRDCLKIRRQSEGHTPNQLLLWEQNYLENSFYLHAEIIQAALSSEKGKQFGVYAVQVTRKESGKEFKWHIYRRYSEFYDFHQWIKSKWMRMSKLEFPSKHTFRSTDRAFLEKRMHALNKYLEEILLMTNEPCFGRSLQDALLHFLEPGPYVLKKKNLTEKIDVFVNPLKQSVKNVTYAVKNAPDTLMSTLDEVTKLFQMKSDDKDLIRAVKVGASLDTGDDENIPLRIILLMMDEVFDLKSRNLWFRRHLVAVIQEILKTMLGDTINRRIVDYVAFLTSPTKVSGYLRHIQNSLWVGGNPISSRVIIQRDPATKMRTRVAAKAYLFSAVSDDLKRVIGSETTRRGLLTVFELCQNNVLNKRFALVLFEGILKTLFPDKPINSVIQRLHYRSNRVGKPRPFLIPSSSKITSLLANPDSYAQLSPRNTRKQRM